MSGGVDSSVAAALLKESGHEVTGVFIKGWYPEWLPCNWREERRDAMRVATRLSIPFETFDCEDAYKKNVADYMIAEYQTGRTPNPDVVCNKTIKFGAFFDEALRCGANMIATGHYARLRQAKSKNKNQKVKIELLTGVDENKDQSYFLWALSQKVLGRTFFPVGDYTKPEVRTIARRFGLPTAEKKESQGLCFLGHVDVHEFLGHYTTIVQGDVLDTSGRVIGKHKGAIVYTLGQRHGFTITSQRSDEGKHYVVAKDMRRNTITVSERLQEEHAVSEVALAEANWIGAEPRVGMSYMARFRYRQKLQRCTIIEAAAAGARIRFDTVQTAVSPGQSLVLYDGEVCLGGGVIV